MNEKLRMEAEELLAEAFACHEETLKEYGDRWLLSTRRSIESWLRGYNAGMKNSKLYNAAIELLNERGV